MHRVSLTDLDSWIRSASGWRTVFATDEHSTAEQSTAGVLEIVLLAAWQFGTAVRAQTANPTVVVGRDTRPTGRLAADFAIRGLIVAGCRVQDVGVAASPEVMAYAKQEPDVHGFFYLTASHNPIGHNGLKFGFADGAVIGGEDAKRIIADFDVTVANSMRVQDILAQAFDPAVSATLGAVTQSTTRNALKDAALEIYRRFALEIAAQPPIAAGFNRTAEIAALVEQLKSALGQRPLGVVGELNGSARCVSIDRGVFVELGVRARFLNDRPGDFAHGVLPEGPNLSQAAQALRQAHAADPAFEIAYVPDNDGDRGNVVLINAEGEPYVPTAQEVFGAVLVAELAWLRHRGLLEAGGTRVAVVVNGPTSLRVDRICAVFGVELYRTEVGEANVVARAAQLRRQGYLVRVCGEGSNGGNITFPGTVRDPMSTILSLLKLRAYELHRYWPALQQAATPRIYDVVRSLPAFTSTATGEARAVMQVPRVGHGALKAAYEALLPGAIETARAILRPVFEPTEWWVENYEGVNATRGTGPHTRSGAQTGGFKVLFADSGAVARAFVWMRGSGTEPVFRVMADVEGEQPEVESRLLEWHRNLIESASAACTA